MMGNPREVIELGLGSIGKIRIMRALAEENKLATIYLLHKKTHLKRDHIKVNLADLVKLGWVTQKMSPNPTFAINLENPYVERLVQFFRDTGYV